MVFVYSNLDLTLDLAVDKDATSNWIMPIEDSGRDWERTEQSARPCLSCSGLVISALPCIAPVLV